MRGRGSTCGRGHAWEGGCVAGETATAADGTHPTGMHSCFPFTYTDGQIESLKKHFNMCVNSFFFGIY